MKKTTKQNMIIPFLVQFKYSTVSEGWTQREWKIIALAKNVTTDVPTNPSYRDDIEEYFKLPLKTICQILRDNAQPLNSKLDDRIKNLLRN